MVNSIKLRSVYSNGNDEAYNGDGASGVYVAAAQLVQSAALTSLVLAAGATTTRASDYCAIENLSDVAWNAAAWSGYVEWENNARVTPAGLFPTVTALRDAPGTNFLQFYLQPTTNTLFVKIVAANVVLYEASGGLPVLAAGAVHRLAYSVTPNGVLVSVNGGAPILYAVAIPTATLAQLVLGNISSNNAGNALGGWIRKAKAWGRALSGLELQVESA